MVNGPGTVPRCECASRSADVRFTIRAEKSAIEPLVAQLVRFATERMPGAEEKHLQIDLALQEAIANAVVHGCKQDSNLKIDCWAAHEPGKGLVVVIRDPGPGFVPADVPDPMQEENLKFDHGRGVFLIRELMDEVHYERNGSEIHLVKY